jgi:predicted permease
MKDPKQEIETKETTGSQPPGVTHLFFSDLAQDLRYGQRLLWKSPGVSVLIVLCLAIGAGANLTIFGLVNAVLLRPARGVHQQGSLVLLGRTENGKGFDASSYLNYQDLRAQASVFTDVAAFHTTPVSLGGADFNERLTSAIVSGNYFDALRVQTSVGRSFLPEEDQTPGKHAVAVLSHDLWERRFARDPGLIGRTVQLNARDVTIIGVAAKGFRGIETGENVDLWLPIAMHTLAMPDAANLFKGRDNNWLDLVARLKPGVSLEKAQAEMNVIAARLREAYPQENQTKGIQVSAHIGLTPDDRAEAVGFLAMVMIISGLVLLIACANAANLLLARAANRRKEIAIRLALGASRPRIIAQFLAESLLLSTAGCLAGSLISLWAKDWLVALFSQALTPEALDFSPDIRMMGFTILLACVTTLLAGFAPAFQASKPDLAPELKDAGGVSGGDKARLGKFFVVGQVALSLALLVSAGLLVRTLQRAYQIHPGFETENLLTLSLDLRLQNYDEPRGREFYRRLMEQVAALPGVRSVSLAVSRPLSWGAHSRTVFLPGQPEDPRQRPPVVDLNLISQGYLQTMNIPLLAGREFTDRDNGDSAGVVLINETMARQFWPKENPMGKRFEVGQTLGRRPVEVVGVIKDAKHRALNETPHPVMYLSFDQEYSPKMFLYLRTAQDALTLLGPVQNEIHRLEPHLPIFDVKTMRRHLDDSIWPQRALAALIGVLGLLAVLLAAAGLYGVVSYTVEQRTREIGVRVALGAQTSDVLQMIIKQGMRLTILGTLIGLAIAWALIRLIRSVVFTTEQADPFFGVSSTDFLAFALTPLGLTAIALLACYFPARRASRVDPMIALRCE